MLGVSILIAIFLTVIVTVFFVLATIFEVDAFSYIIICVLPTALLYGLSAALAYFIVNYVVI